MSRVRIANLPIRLAAGAFIFNSGVTKLSADKETAAQLHEFASGTYPALQGVPPEQFAKGLAIGEVALGSTLLLAPFVGDRVAGLGLTAFAGGLLGMYAKTPGMHDERSVRPTRAGIPLAKDVWLAGIGLTLLVGSRRRRRHHVHTAASN